MKTTKYALAIALGLVALVAPNTMRADSITYNFFGTLQSALNGTTSVSGTFTLNSSIGQVTAWDFLLGSFHVTPLDSQVFPLVPGAAANIAFVFDALCSGVPGTQCADLYMQFISAPGTSSLSFQLPGSSACFATSLQPDPGQIACVDVAGAPVGTYTQSRSNFIAGSASPVPEPTTIILLATGLLGLMGIGLYKKLLAQSGSAANVLTAR